MKISSLHRGLICGTCSWLLWATPSQARFLQVDPVGYDDQVNLYAYVGNDPINLMDPLGTESWLVSRPAMLGYTHMFVVVADRLGARPEARFSYGSSGSVSQTLRNSTNLVSVTGSSRNETDRGDRGAWAALRNPAAAGESGIAVVRIDAADSTVIAAGNLVNAATGSTARPGGIDYSPGAFGDGGNSNTAAYAVANIAVVSEGGRQDTQPTPGQNNIGWNKNEVVERRVPIQRRCEQRICLD